MSPVVTIGTGVEVGVGVGDGVLVDPPPPLHAASASKAAAAAWAFKTGRCTTGQTFTHTMPLRQRIAYHLHRRMKVLQKSDESRE
ncbi:MAG: hypothetical protein H7243_09810 [Sphingomonadaceae bacterium]|nr:hypothetical protein [Sphingomonadaceae bacterium]